MSSLHKNNTVDIKDFKAKFGHYYSTCALDAMTGVYAKYPTYKSINNEIRKYYNSLIEDFCILYRGNKLNNFNSDIYENEGWCNYSDNKEWYHGIQPQHIAILNFIKNGDIDSLRDINEKQGYYIGFYKDCMLKVAIDNEQIESIDYIIRTRQLNRDIQHYVNQVTPQFYDKLVDRYHIKFMRKHKSSPNARAFSLRKRPPTLRGPLHDLNRACCIKEKDVLANSRLRNDLSVWAVRIEI